MPHQADNNIFLSICVPTFNRGRYLKMAVESIIEQVETAFVDKVEIVISDNASTDGTKEIIEKIREEDRVEIKYFKNGENIGFDANVLAVVERSRGKYAWILGDDDLLAGGALKRIMQELQAKDKIDLYFGEKEDFYLTPDKSMKFRKIFPASDARIFDFSNKGTFDRYFKENKKLISYCNYISNIIFSREKWDRVKDKPTFIGTAYVHVYVFQALLWGKEPGVMKYLPVPIVKRRWGNDIITRPGERLKMDVQMYRRIAAAVFTDKKYIRMIDAMVIRNDGFSWAVRAKINDRREFCFELFPLLLSYYWDLPIFWLKIAPLLFTPNFILRVMRGSYRKYVKGERLNSRELLDV